ncbi:MAG: signal recognition particle protein, partial [Candidatus Eisenbacteria sp.]|nr:signal recognition particle protein [Candidatus Eisenbacteria bacterium]
MPGMGKMGRVNVDERALTQVEAIINSMTQDEKRNPGIIDGSRRKRIARGSGTTVQDINRLLKQFDAMKKMARQFGKLGKRGKLPNLTPFGM